MQARALKISVLPSLSSSVPEPKLTLTVIPDSAVLTAGTTANITCDIDIDIAVDSHVEVIASFLDPNGSSATEGDRYGVSNIESITSHEYRYKLTVSPLAVELDDGTFSCSVSITSGSKYVLESFASANDNLTVVGRSST